MRTPEEIQAEMISLAAAQKARIEAAAALHRAQLAFDYEVRFGHPPTATAPELTRCELPDCPAPLIYEPDQHYVRCAAGHRQECFDELHDHYGDA